ncbi:hypothetical protein [Nonomuraea aurantiaca]|uniref:hypothetical protein n=1 Tax=Nonomuraea aurantiaca TaxID=2878562 RepID=UPI001CDA49E6|nr:hypothetical protein [Nonomuraea aurantiaca]MCA2230144.1 hypothetical protein [Nonomuraea aurantiaca]
MSAAFSLMAFALIQEPATGRTSPSILLSMAPAAVLGIAAFALFGGFVPVFVLGLGHGLVATSLMAAAFTTLDRAAVPAATTLSTIAVRLASPFGVAVLAVLLQAFTRGGAGRPFTYAFGCAVVLAAVSLVPIALIGSGTCRESSSAPA